MIITAYAMRLSSISLSSVLQDVVADRGGVVDQGELLFIQQENGGRYVSTSLFARWAK